LSSKSDRDNHSNQLNPNNSAYHSSRGGSGGGGDDDSDGGPVHGISHRVEMWQKEAAEANRKMLRPDPVEREFHFYFVNLGGRVYSHRVMTRIENPRRSLHSSRELVEECFNRVWQALRLLMKEPLAFGKVSTREGEWLEDLGFEYCPGASRATASGCSQVAEYDRRWFAMAQEKVENVKRHVLEGACATRVDLGVITEKMMPGA
jgi:hypothetical protein